MAQVWLNGNFVDESQASVALRDTGLLHAAGAFTTMRSTAGKVFRLVNHLQRLRDSCEALFIPLTYKDDVLAAAVAELLERNELADARLRLTVTRGQAVNDPVHGLRLEPNAFLTCTPVEPYPAEFYERGMTVVLLDEQKLNPYDLQAGHKTLNYFSRLAALREANRRGAGEALWFNVHNYLQSGSISNVFIVKAGTLITPPTPHEMLDPAVREPMPYPKSAVIPGITRGAVIDLARATGIEIQLTAIDVNAVLEADEVFITNSIMEVMPVCRIERRAIGNDKPGPITTDLATRLREMVSG
ncbi:MAG TPA: aminotransferase class IV [Tepidisphaeraceae bacterium]|jgi:branched-chain amino acid aminotransferase